MSSSAEDAIWMHLVNEPLRLARLNDQQVETEIECEAGTRSIRIFSHDPGCLQATISIDVDEIVLTTPADVRAEWFISGKGETDVMADIDIAIAAVLSGSVVEESCACIFGGRRVAMTFTAEGRRIRLVNRILPCLSVARRVRTFPPYPPSR